MWGIFPLTEQLSVSKQDSVFLYTYIQQMVGFLIGSNALTFNFLQSIITTWRKPVIVRKRHYWHLLRSRETTYSNK